MRTQHKCEPCKNMVCQQAANRPSMCKQKGLIGKIAAKLRKRKMFLSEHVYRREGCLVMSYYIQNSVVQMVDLSWF